MAAANRVRGEVAISIGGTEFILVPSFDRLSKVEAALGKSLIGFIQDLSVVRDMTLTDLAGVVEILAREPKLKHEQIGALIVREGAMSILPQVVKVLTRGITGGDDDDGDEGKEPGAGPSAE
jgi:hypothetical protein